MKTYILRKSPSVQPQTGRRATPRVVAAPRGPVLFIGLDGHTYRAGLANMRAGEGVAFGPVCPESEVAVSGPE